MKNLQKFCNHVLNFKHTGPTAVDRCHNLLVAGAVMSRKPENILELGIGTGYVTWSLIYALGYNGRGKLTCVDNWFDWGGTEPMGIDEIRAAGVNVVAPVSEQDFVSRSAADSYDFLVSDADAFLSGLWIDEILRICRTRAFMFFRNTNRRDDLPNLQRIEQRIKQLGLFYYHFTEASRPDERCHTGWLFAINDKTKLAAKSSAVHKNSGVPALGDSRDFESALEKCPASGKDKMLYLGLVAGKNYGWGVCSEYLARELSKKISCHVLNEADGTAANSHLDGKLFQALTGVDFFPMFKNARGSENYGYTFFENELTAHSLENARQYDLVLAGSNWCRERMLERGIENCGVLIQGIDPEKFYPLTEEKKSDDFVIFSGGKFELRKGQDLVLKAVKILQDKYPDIKLVNCWYNIWPESMKLMAYSQYIRFELIDGAWQDVMRRIYTMNGLDATRIQTWDLVPNELQREIYKYTDIGLFPNRCEGGTNLVLMEYMACGKPVIAANASGHRDIVTPENALLLNHLNDLNVVDASGKLVGRWQEPSLDELVAAIEYAYHHREQIKKIGRKAGEDLKHFTWSDSARKLLDLIGL